MMRFRSVIFGVLLFAGGVFAEEEAYPLETESVRIRDPFIYPDQDAKLYYMYAQAGNRSDSGFTGVEVYTSKDLRNWSAPKPVLELPPSMKVLRVWAPEVHKYKSRYYLFVTLTVEGGLPGKPAVDDPKWRELERRGTYVFCADDPCGSFKQLKEGSLTPSDWMALDGTLFVEEDEPYMVFCHEWIQVVDGTMELVRLKDDLSGTVGKPMTLFKASDAPGAFSDPKKGKVTDGCFFYRSPKSGALFMIWSTFIPGKEYCVLATRSASGKVAGPWIEQQIIYGKNGGHGMIFKTFDGLLLIALHQPNGNELERLHLFELLDNGTSLAVGQEVKR